MISLDLLNGKKRLYISRISLQSKFSQHIIAGVMQVMQPVATNTVFLFHSVQDKACSQLGSSTLVIFYSTIAEI
jgi:hypothetical protein